MHSRSNPDPPANALSVDVEDYFHVEAFSRQISPSTWPGFESRVCRNTDRVLAMFARRQCRATFFILGWVAERYPELVRSIAAAGHEVACHGYSHQRIVTISVSAFRADLRRACAVIEDACGKRVVGFRAPTFSVVQESLWALDILAEEGFTYDASIFPVHHDWYGIPDAPRFIHRRQLPSGRSIIEVPPSTARWLGSNIGVGGGGYLRFFPVGVTCRAIRRLHTRDHGGAVVYFHPWEIDPDQPRIPAGLRSRMRHYTGLATMEAKIDTLLQRFRFLPIVDFIAEKFGSVIQEVPAAKTA